MTGEKKELADPGNGIGNDIEKRSLPMALFLFFLPFLISALYITSIFMFFGKGIGYVIGGAMLATTLVLGPEISITAAFIALQGDAYFGQAVWTSPWYMLLIAMSIAFVDAIAAFFLLWNYDLLKKVPWLGPWMDRTEKANRKAIKKSEWRQRFSLIGISIYVMFPVHGSGGLVGTIIGRILGLNRWKVFTAVSIGAFVGALWIAMLVQSVGPTIMNFFESDVFANLVMVLSVIIAAVIIYFVFIRNRKKRKEMKRLAKEKKDMRLPRQAEGGRLKPAQERKDGGNDN